MAKSEKSTRTTAAKPATKKTTKKAEPKVEKKSGITVSVHLPGSLPKTLDLNAGATLADVIKDMNLASYDVTLNGEKVSERTILAADDIVRVGVKTKNA